ncbi:SH3 domain-containing protein [Rhizobium johnstonii]|uniref:SH3 domain-containing protein n=1 Tax=Rhizobium johnstonii TaxID=3019933 RepID=UPI003F99DF77
MTPLPVPPKSRLTSPSRGIYFTNSRDGLNLRSGPGIEFAIIRSLPFATQVHIVKREGRWGLIDELGDGATDGFVHLAFLSERASADTHSGVTLLADA